MEQQEWGNLCPCRRALVTMLEVGMVIGGPMLKDGIYIFANIISRWVSLSPHKDTAYVSRLLKVWALKNNANALGGPAYFLLAYFRQKFSFFFLVCKFNVNFYNIQLLVLFFGSPKLFWVLSPTCWLIVKELPKMQLLTTRYSLGKKKENKGNGIRFCCFKFSRWMWKCMANILLQKLLWRPSLNKKRMQNRKRKNKRTIEAKRKSFKSQVHMIEKSWKEECKYDGEVTC